MPIFGKSKKNRPTLQPQSPPNTFIPQLIPSAQYATATRPNWAYVQRAATSNVHNPPQSEGWLIAPVPSQYQAVFVPQDVHQNSCDTSKLAMMSVSNLLTGDAPEDLPGAQYFNQGAALYDLISSKFDTIITLIDEERFSGD